MVLRGMAEFTGRTTVEIDGEEHSFRQALIATGGTPAVPPVEGLTQSEPLTSDTVWALTALPVHLVVMGGGSIGCELGQAFARDQFARTERADALESLLHCPRHDDQGVLDNVTHEYGPILAG